MNARRGLLIPVGMLVALLLLEVLLRATLPGRLNIRGEADPVTGWRLLPNQRGFNYVLGEFAVSYITNSHGDPDVERSLSKPAGVYRVAMVGDSMTEGAQVEPQQRFSALLEGQLNAWLAKQFPGRRVEVLNFSVGGFSPAQELLLYRTHVRRFEPDLVVLVFFPDNDVRGDSLELDATGPGVIEEAPFFRLDASGGLVLKNPQFYANARGASARGGRLRSAYRWLRDHSALVDALVWSYQGLRKRAASGIYPVDLGLWVPSVQRVQVWQDAWTVTRAIIGEFAQEAKSDGARFHVAVATGPLEVNEGTRQLVFSRLSSSVPAGEAQAYDWDLPYRMAEQMLVDLGLPFSDLWPVMKSAARRGERTNFISDGHYTPAGHRIAAAELFPVLQRYVLAQLAREVRPTKR